MLSYRKEMQEKGKKYQLHLCRHNKFIIELSKNMYLSLKLFDRHLKVSLVSRNFLALTRHGDSVQTFLTRSLTLATPRIEIAIHREGSRSRGEGARPATRELARPHGDIFSPAWIQFERISQPESRDGRYFCTIRAVRRMRIGRGERTDARPIEESYGENTQDHGVTVINHPRSYSGDLFRFLLARRRSSLGLSRLKRDGGEDR